MKKTGALIKKLLEELERTPLIQVACEKVGISRNTFYRWVKKDKKLTDQVNEALSLGTGVVNDIAVSNVLNGIQKGDFKYTMLWLDRRHPDFRRPLIVKNDDDVIQYRRRVREQSQDIKAVNDARTEALETSEEHKKHLKEVKELFRRNRPGIIAHREKREKELYDRSRIKEMIRRRDERNK